MLSWIKSFFSRELHQILGDITQKIEELHAHADAKLQEFEQHNAIAADALAAASAAKQVEEKARAIAGKFTALIS